MKYADLVAVLDFMYQGEVNLAQEGLDTFLAVAEDLRVKGLTQNNSTTDHAPSPTPPPERDPVPMLPLKQPLPASPPEIKTSGRTPGAPKFETTLA